tara:strand:- start:157 stop:420 length:264 start_codon:yes stop_codon:yes gene_type:complete
MNQENLRGRRVLIYGYTGAAEIDPALVNGTQGIVLDQERQAYLVFCPVVNRVLTFSQYEIDVIWREKEAKMVKDYHKNLYISSQNKR